MAYGANLPVRKSMVRARTMLPSSRSRLGNRIGWLTASKFTRELLLSWGWWAGHDFDSSVYIVLVICTYYNLNEIPRFLVSVTRSRCEVSADCQMQRNERETDRRDL